MYSDHFLKVSNMLGSEVFVWQLGRVLISVLFIGWLDNLANLLTDIL